MGLNALAILLMFAALAPPTCDISAQVFCTPNSVWHHDKGGFLYFGYDRVEYIGDTVVEGRACHRLETTGMLDGTWWGQGVFETVDTDILIHVDGDLVLTHDQTWDTLYDFAATPGQYWGIPDLWPDMGCSPDARVAVMDTGHLVLDGLSLKFLSVDLIYDEVNSIRDTIVERIGALHSPIRLRSVCITDSGYGALRCFQDNTLSYLAPTSSGCTGNVGVDEDHPGRPPSAWIDGDDCVLDLRTEFGQCTIQHFDITGKLCQFGVGTGLMRLPSFNGMNIIKIMRSDGVVHSLRLIRN